DPEFETVDDPALPWRKTVKLRGIEAPTVLPVLVEPDAGSGRLTCRIVYRGRTLAEKAGAEDVSSAGCVAASPITGLHRWWVTPGSRLYPSIHPTPPYAVLCPGSASVLTVVDHVV